MQGVCSSYHSDNLSAVSLDELEREYEYLLASQRELETAKTILEEVKSNLEISLEALRRRIENFDKSEWERSKRGDGRVEFQRRTAELMKVESKYEEVVSQLAQLNNEMEETALEIQRKEIQVVSLRSGYAQETIQKAIEAENRQQEMGAAVPVEELRTLLKFCFVRLHYSTMYTAFAQWKFFTQRKLSQNRSERMAAGRIRKLRLRNAVYVWRMAWAAEITRQTAFTTLLSRQRHRRLSHAVQQWIGACRCSFGIKALYRRSLLKDMLRGFATWKFALKRKSSNKQLMLLGKLRCLRDTVTWWKRVAIFYKKRHKRFRVAIASVQQLRLMHIFKAWARRAQLQSRFIVARLDEVLQRKKLSILSSAFRQLRFHTVELNLLQETTYHMRLFLEFRQQRKAITLKYKRSTLKHFFNEWLGFVAEAELDRKALVYLYSRCITKSWTGWKQIVMTNREETRKVYKALLFARRKLQRRAMDGWALVSRTAKHTLSAVSSSSSVFISAPHLSAKTTLRAAPCGPSSKPLAERSSSALMTGVMGQEKVTDKLSRVSKPRQFLKKGSKASLERQLLSQNGPLTGKIADLGYGRRGDVRKGF